MITEYGDGSCGSTLARRTSTAPRAEDNPYGKDTPKDCILNKHTQVSEISSSVYIKVSSLGGAPVLYIPPAPLLTALFSTAFPGLI